MTPSSTAGRAPWILTATCALALLGCRTTTETRLDGDGSVSSTSREAELRGGWASTWGQVLAELGRDLEPPAPGTEQIHEARLRAAPIEVDANLARRELYRGEHLAVELLAVSRAVPPPATPAGEALIVVEGRGIVEIAGRRTLVEDGTVALLPPGARGRLEPVLPAGGPAPPPGPDSPLLILRVRSLQPASAAGEASARVLPFAEVVPFELQTTRQPSLRQPLAAIPGHLSLAALSVLVSIPRHLHQERDELLFLIEGRGTLGRGSEGDSRLFTEFPVSQQALPYLPARAPHSYATADGVRTLALSFSGPDDAAGADAYEVGTSPERLPAPPTRVQARGGE